MSEPSIFTRGRITWENAGTARESLTLGLGAHDTLYCGPVAGKTGWRLVAFSGQTCVTIGAVTNPEAARILIERLAELIAPDRAKPPNPSEAPHGR